MFRGACIVVVITLSLATVHASGSVLYGTAGSGLYVIDPANGMAIPRGTTVGGSVRDMASDWRPDSTRLWGTGAVSINESLIRYSTLTGSSTVVGSYGLPFGRAMRSLAFDVTSGKLVGVAEDAPFGSGANWLYEIDPDTAAATLVGAVGFRSVGALSFDTTGRLFGVSNVPDQINLIEINPQTAAASLVAPIALDGVGDLAPRPEDGVMILATVDVPLGGLNRLYTLDLASGAVTPLTQVMTTTPISGLAFVPEPSAAGIALLLTTGAALKRRRRSGYYNRNIKTYYAYQNGYDGK